MFVLLLAFFINFGIHFCLDNLLGFLNSHLLGLPFGALEFLNGPNL